jgi:YD repeat-containing protein
MQDSSEVITWTYDRRGQTLQETKFVSPTASSTLSGTFVTQWGYNSADLVTYMKYPVGNTGQVGEGVSYTYTAQMGLSQVTSGAFVYAQNSYDEAGRMVSRALGGGTVTSNYSYNPWDQQGGGRLGSLVSTYKNTSPQNLSYTYDQDGNITQIVDAEANETLNYAYDLANRLTGVSGAYSEAYNYNATSGNLANKAGVSYTYDTSHPHAVKSLNSVQKYWYDANGNQTKRITTSGTYTLTYNAENQMTGVTGGTTAAFLYDGDGNRVKATVSGTTTVYIGNYFEWSGTMKKYYYAGATRVTMRTGTGSGTTGLKWLLEDHLFI